jgi:agmatinase
VGADIVEVAPPFDHAEVTAVAASHVAYELLALFAREAPVPRQNDPPDAPTKA